MAVKEKGSKLHDIGDVVQIREWDDMDRMYRGGFYYKADSHFAPNDAEVMFIRQMREYCSLRYVVVSYHGDKTYRLAEINDPSVKIPFIWEDWMFEDEPQAEMPEISATDLISLLGGVSHA